MRGSFTILLMLLIVVALCSVAIKSSADNYCPRPEELPACDDPQPVTLCYTTNGGTGQ